MVFLKLPRHHVRVQLDVAGIVTMAVSVTSIILVSSWGGTQYDWSSPQIVGLSALAVVAAVLFVLAERRAAEPIIPLSLFRSRNFVLATAAGLFIGVAMFGAIGYMPTYLQMVTGASATVSGLQMVSMVLGLMLTALTTGQLAARTGRYKWMPLVGMVVIAIALVLMSTLTPSTPLLVLLGYLFLLGAGVGLGMQILVLVVQNSFPDRMVGTATAANNFFREIGAAVGTALFSTIFTTRLTERLTDVFAGSGGGVDTSGGAESLTPAVVAQLPDAVHDGVVNAYTDALAPAFWYLVPLLAIGFVLTLFLKEVKLSDVAGMVARGEAVGAAPAAATSAQDQPSASSQDKLPASSQDEPSASAPTGNLRE